MEWLTDDAVKALNAALVAAYGGSGAAVRDPNLLGSAVARPRQLHAYQPDASLCELAASLAFGLAKNHAFLDGNKRTACAACATFLDLNGLQITGAETEHLQLIVDLAQGLATEADFAAWLARNTSAV